MLIRSTASASVPATAAGGAGGLWASLARLSQASLAYSSAAMRLMVELYGVADLEGNAGVV
jgi:hypothetical protein